MSNLIQAILVLASVVAAGMGLFLPHQPYPIYVTVLLWYILVANAILVITTSWAGLLASSVLMRGKR